MVSNIRHTEDQVFANIRTGNVRKYAEKFGVRIKDNRYWFTFDNWQEFLKESCLYKLERGGEVSYSETKPAVWGALDFRLYEWLRGEWVQIGGRI